MAQTLMNEDEWLATDDVTKMYRMLCTCRGDAFLSERSKVYPVQYIPDQYRGESFCPSLHKLNMLIPAFARLSPLWRYSTHREALLVIENKEGRGCESAQFVEDWCMAARDHAPSKRFRAGVLRSMIGNPWKPFEIHSSGECPKCQGRGTRKKGHGQNTAQKVCQWCGGTKQYRPWATEQVIGLARQAYYERERVCGRCKGNKYMRVENQMESSYATSRMVFRGGIGKMSQPSIQTIEIKCNECRGVGRIDDGTMDPVILGLLADALLDAGCPDEPCEIIRELRRPREYICDSKGSHAHAGNKGQYIHGEYHDTDPSRSHHHHDEKCEQSGRRYRGFWPVDLLLGKN